MAPAPSLDLGNLAPVSITILGITAIIVAGIVSNAGYLKIIFGVALLLLSIVFMYAVIYLASKH